MPDSHIISVDLFRKEMKVLDYTPLCQGVDTCENTGLYFNCSLVLEEVGKIFLYKFTELGVSWFSGDKANYHVSEWNRLSLPIYKFGETSTLLDTRDEFI